MTADDSYGRLDDDDYPACTMGRAAEMLGTTPNFLRALGNARIIILEDQLEEARRINAEYRRGAEAANPPTAA